MTTSAVVRMAALELYAVSLGGSLGDDVEREPEPQPRSLCGPIRRGACRPHLDLRSWRAAVINQRFWMWMREMFTTPEHDGLGDN